MNNPGRCLLAVTHIFEPTGGIDVVNRLVVHTLAERSWQVDIVSLNDRRQTRLDERYIPLAQATYQAFAGNKWGFVKAVYSCLLRQKYDLVLVDLVNVASMLAPGQMMGQSFWVWLFGIEVFPPNPSWEGKIGMRLASERLAISEHTRNSVRQRFPELNIKTCALALDPFHHVKELPKERTVREMPPIRLTSVNGQSSTLGRCVILHVGRMVQTAKRDKGQEVLIKAMPHILDVHPEAQLVLVGKGPERERLRLLAHQLPTPVSSHVFMPGFVTDEMLDELYEQCFVFAMPSLGEGFGLVYLEAMSRAKPCIGARADATSELIHEGKNGMLVQQATSAHEVSEVVNLLLAHPQRAKEMGWRGYQKVRENYLFEHFAQRFWNIVEGFPGY